MYWRPDQAVRANPDWRPYYDMGHWTQSDNGLFWQSDYTWGDIPFHYGRWVADIDALRQSDPNIDPAVIECMKKTGSSS